MAYLFLDSTNGLTLGILNENLDWLDYEDLAEKKPSEVVHAKINLLLEKQKINFKELTLILAAGPGSYTGMRLGEGIAHILNLTGVKVISFYHFEVPSFMGIAEGRFVTNAFKGQYFVYDWNLEKNTQLLMNANDMNFSYSVYSNAADEKFSNIKFTKNLIKENAKDIFQKVIERNAFLSSFYFRTLDDEFKATC